MFHWERIVKYSAYCIYVVFLCGMITEDDSDDDDHDDICIDVCCKIMPIIILSYG